MNEDVSGIKVCC